MGFCSDGTWEMVLVIDRCSNSNPPCVGTFVFDLKPIGPGGAITGTVTLPDGNMTDVSGRCIRGVGPVAAMHLEFDMKASGVRIHLSGAVFNDTSYIGNFRADSPRRNIQDAPGNFNPEVGDTGTGTGNQTTFLKRRGAQKSRKGSSSTKSRK